MKVILSILALLACVAAVLWYWSTGRPGPTPFAEQVPPNAILYIAVPDLPAWLDDLNDHPRWKEALPVKPFLARVEENRAHLAGPGALFAVLKNDRYPVAFLVNPIRLDTIRKIVSKGERFPQKTTDFYPKLLTGLLLCKLNYV